MGVFYRSSDIDGALEDGVVDLSIEALRDRWKVVMYYIDFSGRRSADVGFDSGGEDVGVVRKVDIVVQQCGSWCR